MMSWPARTPEAAAALLRPFFLMMKLAPMNPLDSRASTNPFRLSVEDPILPQNLPSRSIYRKPKSQRLPFFSLFTRLVSGWHVPQTDWRKKEELIDGVLPVRRKIWIQSADNKNGRDENKTQGQNRHFVRRKLQAIIAVGASRFLYDLKVLSRLQLRDPNMKSNHNRGAEVGLVLPICLRNWLFIASPALKSHLYSYVSCVPNPYSPKLDESLPVSGFYREQDRSISQLVSCNPANYAIVFPARNIIDVESIIYIDKNEMTILIQQRFV